MLSVNRILIFIFIAIFSSSLYAVDISNFDIKGIKLGMSKSKVLKKMPCSHPEIEKDYINTINGKRAYNIDITCNNNSETLTISLSHNNIAYNIFRSKGFKISPNWKTIEKKIFQKYKNPTQEIERNKPSARNSTVYRMWWVTNGKQLVIHSHDWNGSYLVFNLQDKNMTNKNDNWATKQQYAYKQKEKEKASNIDF